MFTFGTLEAKLLLQNSVNQWYHFTFENGGTELLKSKAFNSLPLENLVSPITEVRLATFDEIIKSLLKDCERFNIKNTYSSILVRVNGVRGVRPGDICYFGQNFANVKVFDSIYPKEDMTVGSKFGYNFDTDTLYSWGRGVVVIYENGTWAEVIN